MAEIRAWISGTDRLTAGQLTEFLAHVPDTAALVDSLGDVLGSVEAIWQTKDGEQ